MPNHHLRILHVSDLHERVALPWMEEERRQTVAARAAQRYRVLDESNFRDILSGIGKERPVDLVCFTGDLADWGLAEEYAKVTPRIEDLLQRTGASRQGLFLVPGNHDVNRKKQESVWSEVRKLSLEGTSRVSEWMAGGATPYGAAASWRDAIGERTSAFWNWVEKDLHLDHLLPKNNIHRRLGYRHTPPLSHLGLPFAIHVFGLDSAWLAGDENDARKLRLTRAQIDMHTRDAEGKPLSGFRLALLHHPISDLSDEADTRSLLSSTTDLVLHGHQHDPVVQTTEDPDRGLRAIAAGSLYEGDEGDKWINGFHVIDAELNEGGTLLRYRVSWWSWSPKSVEWCRGSGIYRSAPDGILDVLVSTPGMAPRREAITTGGAFSAPVRVREELADVLERLATGDYPTLDIQRSWTPNAARSRPPMRKCYLHFKCGRSF